MALIKLMCMLLWLREKTHKRHFRKRWLLCSRGWKRTTLLGNCSERSGKASISGLRHAFRMQSASTRTVVDLSEAANVFSGDWSLTLTLYTYVVNLLRPKMFNKKSRPILGQVFVFSNSLADILLPQNVSRYAIPVSSFCIITHRLSFMPSKCLHTARLSQGLLSYTS